MLPRGSYTRGLAVAEKALADAGIESLHGSLRQLAQEVIATILVDATLSDPAWTEERLKKCFYLFNGLEAEGARRARIMDFIDEVVHGPDLGEDGFPQDVCGRTRELSVVASTEMFINGDGSWWPSDDDPRMFAARAAIDAWSSSGGADGPKWDVVDDFLELYGLRSKALPPDARPADYTHPLKAAWRRFKKAKRARKKG